MKAVAKNLITLTEAAACRIKVIYAKRPERTVSFASPLANYE